MPSDVLPLALTNEAVAWMAFTTGLVALTKQAYDIIRNRKRERREINEALDRQPLVREQLELGNVGAAVEHLTAIIDQMDKAKKRDDADSAARDKRHRAKVIELERREQDLEEEARTWEQRYDAQHQRHLEAMAEWERKYERLDERCRKITAVLRRHHWDIEDEG